MRFSAHTRSIFRQHLALAFLIAIVSVAFGGAIGPEAGLLSIVPLCDTLISLRAAQTQAQFDEMNESTQAAALAGLYGSAPGAVLYTSKQSGTHKLSTKISTWTAAISGFLTFWLLLKLSSVSSHPIDLPAVPEPSVKQFVLSALAALVACAMATLYLLVRHALGRLTAYVQHPHLPVWLIMIGSAVLGLLLAAIPVLRFFGHESVGLLPNLVQSKPAGFFLVLTLMKILATTLSVRVGWLGGEFFRLSVYRRPFVHGRVSAYSRHERDARHHCRHHRRYASRTQQITCRPAYCFADFLLCDSRGIPCQCPRHHLPGPSSTVADKRRTWLAQEHRKRHAPVKSHINAIFCITDHRQTQYATRLRACTSLSLVLSQKFCFTCA
ncbi:chloride channel protein [Alloscardovia criceti]|uniref:chloride channel protein n=1 Tax=Alloscardovia criceti TaxID=356828 RepID=UPI0003A56271|nr:chloride channel protein [Alloscardovia criceti]